MKDDYFNAMYKITKSFDKNILENWQKYVEEINDVNLDKITGNFPKSANISKEYSIRNLTTAYQNEKLVFVLGAGISIEFGIPAWNNLLQNLMVYTIEEEHRVSSALSKLFNDIYTPNPLIAGRYLQNYFENNNSSFESMVREVLYAGVDKTRDSELLFEIVKMCVSPGKSPNLDSIITYNFDDILEFKLDDTGMDVPYKSIYGPGMDIKNEELPIYHVHGYLPEKKKLNSDNAITFGENNYHQQYSDIYSWNNIVQINKFRENTCLFIGSSLTDPNIRRLLDIAYKQKGDKRKHHYIFKKRIDSDSLKENLHSILNKENINEKNNAGLNIDETVLLLKNLYERFEENDSASFGVKTIWLETHREIPGILKKMREKVSK